MSHHSDLLQQHHSSLLAMPGSHVGAVQRLEGGARPRAPPPGTAPGLDTGLSGRPALPGALSRKRGKAPPIMGVRSY